MTEVGMAEENTQKIRTNTCPETILLITTPDVAPEIIPVTVWTPVATKVTEVHLKMTQQTEDEIAKGNTTKRLRKTRTKITKMLTTHNATETKTKAATTQKKPFAPAKALVTAKWWLAMMIIVRLFGFILSVWG